MIIRLSLLLCSLGGTLASAELVLLKPHAPAPGTSIRIVAKTTSTGGVMTIIRGGKVRLPMKTEVIKTVQ